MPESATSYLHRIVQAIEEVGGRFPEEPTIEPRSPEDDQGVLDTIAILADGSKLAVSVFADTSGLGPIWLKYRFHYMNAEDICIFRYDNTPHHPGLTAFPHHKHEGPNEHVTESGPPDIELVLDEVLKHIRAAD